MDIVDALVLTVGLDASKFVKGQKEIAQSLKKTKETSIADGKAIETSMTAASAGVGKLVAAFLGLTAVFTGGKQVGKFMEDVTRGDATLGRFANNLRMSTKDLQSWQGAVESVGGAASDVTSSVQGLSDSFQALKIFGDPGIVKALAIIGTRGGKRIDINKPINQTLLDLSEDLSKIAKTDPAQASYLGRQIGLNQNLINVLIKGRAETEKLLAIQAKYAASRADIDAAEKRQSAWQRLQAAGESFGRTILTAVTPALMKLNELLRQFVEWAKSQLPAVQKAFTETFGSFDEILDSIHKTLGKPNWKEWFEAIKGLGKDINNVAQWFGGWKNTLELLMGLAVLNWLTPIVTAFGLLTGYILSLVGAGPALAALFAIGGPLAALGALYGLVRPQGLNEGEDELARQRRYGQGGGGTGGGGGDQVTEPGAHHPPYSGGTGAHKGQRSLLLGGAHGGGNPGGGGGKPNANFTKENADAIRESAARLGTSPEDLATVIGYETGGTYNPSKWGGLGGRYMGLIQFGPSERKQYGAYEGQPFKEQMGAVERYLTDRGFKPGMGLLDLYSTILTGSPGHYEKRDINGSVREHVARMAAGAHAARARKFLESGNTAPPSDTNAYTAPGAGVPSEFNGQKYTDYFTNRSSSLSKEVDDLAKKSRDETTKKRAQEIAGARMGLLSGHHIYHDNTTIFRHAYPHYLRAIAEHRKELKEKRDLELWKRQGEANTGGSSKHGGYGFKSPPGTLGNFSHDKGIIPRHTWQRHFLPDRGLNLNNMPWLNSGKHLQSASLGAGHHINSHNTTASHEVHVGAVNVHTSPNSDASGIVRDIKPALERASFASLGNYSLA